MPGRPPHQSASILALLQAIFHIVTRVILEGALSLTQKQPMPHVQLLIR